MDGSFDKQPPEYPTRKSDSPEDLICNFTRNNRFMVEYSTYDAATDSIKIDASLFILPFDDFLRSIKEFKPVRSHVKGLTKGGDHFAVTPGAVP